MCGQGEKIIYKFETNNEREREKQTGDKLFFGNK